MYRPVIQKNKKNFGLFLKNNLIHTFGRDLKWNTHVHMRVIEGGKGKVTIWRNFKYFSYEALRKRWQKILLDAIIKEK